MTSAFICSGWRAAGSVLPFGSAAARGARPILPNMIRDALPEADLLSYIEAILRVYNLHGRRDNIHKARIKILINSIGIEAFRDEVEAEWVRIKDGVLKLPEQEIARIEAYFAPPRVRGAAAAGGAAPGRSEFRSLGDAQHTRPQATGLCHRHDYAEAHRWHSWRRLGGANGRHRRDRPALLLDEVRVSHEQNLVLPHVRLGDLWSLYQDLKAIGLAEANAGLATDIIACPGLDYCALANARSIPIAQRLSARLAPRQDLVGDLKIKISGCINACGHHHVGAIGILGVEKRGEEHYQLLLGGSGTEMAALASITGPGFGPDGIVDAVEKVVDTYLRLRAGPQEAFLAAYARLGAEPFKEAIYASA